MEKRSVKKNKKIKNLYRNSDPDLDFRYKKSKIKVEEIKKPKLLGKKRSKNQFKSKARYKRRKKK